MKTWFFLCNINEISISRDKKKEKYQLGDYKLIQFVIAIIFIIYCKRIEILKCVLRTFIIIIIIIQYQILWTNIMRIVWQPVGRITTEILEVKGLKVHKTIIYYKISVH